MEDLSDESVIGPSTAAPSPTDSAEAPSASASPPADEPTDQTAPSPDEPTTSSSGPAAHEVPAEVADVAHVFLAARENAVSYYHAASTSWLADVREVMTDDAYEELASTVSEGGGSAHSWDTSHELGLAVRVFTECSINPAAGSAEDRQYVLCSVVDQVIDEAGDAVPTTEIPPSWPYVGPQPTALLEMVRVDGEWKVGADMTGTAS